MWVSIVCVGSRQSAVGTWLAAHAEIGLPGVFPSTPIRRLSTPSLWVGLLALILLVRTATGVELGNTKAEVLAKHGAPQIEAAEGCVYQWADWNLEVAFREGVVRRLTYSKAAPLTETDVQGVFTANGGMAAWTKGSGVLWIRTDGARAALEQERRLVLESAPRVPQLATHPTLIPAPPRATPHIMVPPRPINAAATLPKPATLRPAVQPNNHFWLIALSWVPLLLITLFGKYLSKWAAPTRGFGPADAIYPTPSISESWQRPSLDTVSWSQFELVIAECYRRQGYEVEVSSGLGADGGIDVKLTKAGETVLVQCKQWKTYKVSVKEIREFYGVLVSEGARRGLFVNTGEYTRDCRVFAEGKPIELLGRADIEQMVAAVQEPGENLWDFASWLPNFMTEARIITPLCPKCGSPMTLRHSDRNPPFWGCSAYPRCRGKRDARLELLRTQSY